MHNSGGATARVGCRAQIALLSDISIRHDAAKEAAGCYNSRWNWTSFARVQYLTVLAPGDAIILWQHRLSMGGWLNTMNHSIHLWIFVISCSVPFSMYSVPTPDALGSAVWRCPHGLVHGQAPEQ